ncbi:MAG TPA: hypothetical protein VL995_13100 [Cellvibrio sp.]|nr:hypothetical protein [Cellvibrio sp.]
MTFRNVYLYSAFLVSVFSTGASAAIIEGHFTGNIWNYYDNGHVANSRWIKVFDTDIKNAPFKGSFWYDTKLAPPNTGLSGQVRVSDIPIEQWLGFSFEIEGKEFANTGAFFDGSTPKNFYSKLALGSDEEQIWLRDDASEFFGLVAGRGNYDPDYRLGFGETFAISFHKILGPYLNTDSLIQKFDWVDPISHYDNFDEMPVVGYFNISGVSAKDPYSARSEWGAAIAAHITEISVAPRHQIELPEPRLPILVVLAVLLVICKRSKLFNVK